MLITHTEHVQNHEQRCRCSIASHTVGPKLSLQTLFEEVRERMVKKQDWQGLMLGDSADAFADHLKMDTRTASTAGHQHLYASSAA